MGNISNSPNFDPSDPELLKVHRVENHTQGLSLTYQDFSFSSDLLLFGSLTQLLEKKVNEFLTPSDAEFLFQKDLFEILRGIKNLFITLAKRDLSTDFRFADLLSRHWHQLLRHIDEERGQKKSSLYFKELMDFANSLDLYPKNSEHSLGYYLTMFTGEKWLPFPFMELLSELHIECNLKGENSSLKKWILTIDQILHLTPKS